VTERSAARSRAVGAVQAALRWIRVQEQRLYAWRRIRFTTGGLAFTLGTLAVGFAALNTGNNLLYLLLGAMLGSMVVSGWLSEQAIRGLLVEREPTHPVTVGQDLRITYHVRNTKRRIPSMAVEILEEGLPNAAFVAHAPAMGEARPSSRNRFTRRGTFPLGTVTLSTAFPFGLFRKERDVEIPGEIVVWPRCGRALRPTVHSHGREALAPPSAAGSPGSRGEFRSLRGYRPGDDPRDIHWRSSARLQEPVVREYERDAARTRWICLDVRGRPDEAAEVAVEVAASLAARAAAEGRAFGLAAGDLAVDPGEGPGQLARVLDMLARVDFELDAAEPHPPVSPAGCVLVSIDGAGGFGDTYLVERDARPEPVPGTGAA